MSLRKENKQNNKLCLTEFKTVKGNMRVEIYSLYLGYSKI